jgi:dUTPase
VVRGVVDSDYIGEIKVLISPPTKTVQINKGQRVTQLLHLPYYQTRKTLTSQARSPRGFGSSDLAFWVQEITASRPLKFKKIKCQGY